MIKGKSNDLSYTEVLTRLKANIPLKEIGISNTKIKKTDTGALLIEIPGTNTKDLAEELRTRASAILSESATVTRPEGKGGIRVVGFDESVNASDIASGIAALGGCDGTEVTVIPITPMRNGLFMTWIRCHATAAVKASKVGKITLGWTVARL